MNSNKANLTTASIAFGLFCLVTLSMFFSPVREASGDLLFKIMYTRSDVWTTIMVGAGYIGRFQTLLALTILFALFLVRLKRSLEAKNFVLTMAISPFILILVKSILSMHPPSSLNAALELNQMLTYPSDQTFGATVFFLNLTIRLFGIIKSQVYRRMALVASILFISLTGLSRIYHGRHFPADVIASIFLGAAFVFGASYFFKKYNVSVVTQRLKPLSKKTGSFVLSSKPPGFAD